jgi:hypothetical protein
MLLRRNLTDYFSDDELRALCSEIGIDYEHLRGQGKAAKASELVRTLAARGRIPELVPQAARLRPDVSWGDMPGDLAAGTGSPLERPAPPTGIGPALRLLGWLVAALIVVAGLVFVLGGRLRLGKPATTPVLATGTPSARPTTSTPVVPTPTPTEVAVTATPQWTLAPPTETYSPLPTLTPEPAPTGTPAPPALAVSNAPRVVTLLAPHTGACSKSPVITFKWTGTALRPGESFLVVIVPSQVKKGKCTTNYATGVQYSPPLKGYEWTTDISAPPQVPAACAGPVEWTVYISSATRNVAQAAPVQYFEWNPLRCIQ